MRTLIVPFVGHVSSGCGQNSTADVIKNLIGQSHFEPPPLAEDFKLLDQKKRQQFTHVHKFGGRFELEIMRMH
jgi:hypothetical protein